MEQIRTGSEQKKHITTRRDREGIRDYGTLRLRRSFSVGADDLSADRQALMERIRTGSEQKNHIGTEKP